jgi:hypothetical protein
MYRQPPEVYKVIERLNWIRLHGSVHAIQFFRKPRIRSFKYTAGRSAVGRQEDERRSWSWRIGPGAGDQRRIIVTYTWKPEGQIFEVREGRNRIGRDPTQCDIVIEQD